MKRSVMVVHHSHMAMKTLACAALFLGSSACATIPPVKSDGIDVTFGQTANVDGAKIRPIKLIEDSRCPINARCIWAGRVRILAAWVRADGEQQLELTLGEPTPLADGALTLTEVKPTRMAGESNILPASDYRFTFQFAGDL